MSDGMMAEVILLRMSRFTLATRLFAEQLERESRRRVACLVDERSGPVDVEPFPKVSLTEESIRELRLYCPPDVGWRCGDYGLYLARRGFPQSTHFWVMDYDVRISGHDLGAFFSSFEAFPEVDLIAPFYGRAPADWHWRHPIRSRDKAVYSCMFPLVRVSAAAVDRLLLRRQAMSRRLISRLYWPNDEGTVATTLSHDGSICRDMNDFGRVFYTNETFSFFTAADGDALDLSATEMMAYHPVLFGEEYKRKLVNQQRPETRSEKFRRRLVSVLNSQMRW